MPETLPPRTIELSCHGITVTLGAPDPGRPGAYLGGTINSNLWEGVDSHDPDNLRTFGAVNALESFILAAACAGVDITAPAFLEAIETTADKIGNEI